MYKSFRVRNFRCFKDLQINELGRVNLIAGKNNTGKTALMEAMCLHTRPSEPETLLHLQQARGLEVPEVDLRTFWKQFFYNMEVSKEIEIEMTQVLPDNYPILAISELPNNDENADMFLQYAKYLHTLGMSQLDAAKATSELEFLLDVREKKAKRTGARFGSCMPSDSRLPIRSFARQPAKSRFVPAQGRPSNEEIADQYSKLTVRNRHSLVEQALKQLEHQLSSATILSPYGLRMLWIQINGTQMPLRLLGEGANRFAHFLMTMLDEDLQYLFIDEIENGIHHSVQKDVWKAIGQVAREEDIQVFATTHSYEMIEAANEAFKDDDVDDFRFHRLYRDSATGNIEARTYNEFSIDAAISRDREVRG